MISKFSQHIQKYELYYAVSFFFLGIIFDIFTLGRPDELFNLLQQFIYLNILSLLFYFDFKAIYHPASELQSKSWWKYHELLAHFLYGSLLSAFTLFFLKSSSFISSFMFLFLMMILLVVNELPQFQKRGPQVRALLLTLCWFCYLLLLIPLLLSFIGWLSFILSFVVLAIMLAGYYKKFMKEFPANHKEVKKQVLYPAIIVMNLVAVFYFFQIIPPVPLHVEQIGIFHGLEKNNGEYKALSYNKDCPHWFKSQHSHFHSQPGDKVYLFFSLFAPARMEDEVMVHWRIKLNGAWKTSDRIPVHIKGGRETGFRGYTNKSSIQAGDWQVRIETTDGRVIGSLKFEILNEPHGSATYDLF